MANLREPYAATGLASLEWSEQLERAVDRVAAGGMATAFGLNLWKSRYGLEVKAYQDALGELRRRAIARFSRSETDLLWKLCDQAMHEYLSQHCRTCLGAREMVAGDKRITCPDCSGFGVHRYSDFERARFMKISYAMAKHSANKLRWLVNELMTEDSNTNAEIARQLERYGVAA